MDIKIWYETNNLPYLFLGAVSAPIRAQQLDCSNIGFEGVTTEGWTLTKGQVANQGQEDVFLSETAGTIENGHQTMRVTNGSDPKINAEAIPMVAPGSTYSIRIGNVTRGSRFDHIKGSFIVTSDNTLFPGMYPSVYDSGRTGLSGIFHLVR